MVTLTVRGNTFGVSADQATLMAEELRRRAAGHFGDAYGMEGSRELADALELRLTDEREDEVVLDDVQAIALFHLLNLDPHGVKVGGPLRELYLAVREIHDEA